MIRVLKNGYTVIAEKPDDGRGQMAGTIVLAVIDDAEPNDGVEYATWWHRNEDGETFHGNYFHEHFSGSVENAFLKAVTDFMTRDR